MKKLTTVAVLISIALSGLATPSANAANLAKSGSTCTKAGSKQIVATKTFTCVKVGKKLVWDKGVLTKPAPSATAPVITLNNLDPAWTLKVALANVIAKYKSQAASTIQPTVIASPTVTAKEVDRERQLLSAVMATFEQYFAPSKFQVIMFSNEDSDWADNALSTYGGSYPFKVSDEIKKWSTNGRYCNFAFATMGTGNIPTYYECTDTRKDRDWTNFQNPPHEYFHLVQSATAQAQIPSWLTEGSASFIGEALGYKDFTNPLQSTKDMNINTGHEFDPDSQGFNPDRFVKWMKTANVAEVTSVFKYLESTQVSNFDGSKHAYYSLGSIATEVLVAVYGVDGFMKIFSELKSGKSFPDAFKAAYGVTPDEFYAKLTPYLNKR